jgi:hypothetical protein
MRLTKILGLVMAAAIAAMALMGAATASAHSTALCKALELPCSAANTYGATTIKSQLVAGTHATLKSSVGPVLCEKSTVEGTTAGGLATTLLGEITKLTFTSCKLGETSCTVTAEGLPYTSHLLIIPGTHNGEFVTLEPSAKVVCGSFINCTFGFEEINLELVGGNPATIAAEEELLTREAGFFCPGESHWTAKYEVTSPKPLFVSE